MEEFILNKTSKNPFANEFQGMLKAMVKRPGKVYSTQVEVHIGIDEGVDGIYFFETTSKDISLGLCALPHYGSTELACLLEFEFLKRNCSSLLFSETQDRDAILVVRTVVGLNAEGDTKIITFTLSKAGR